MCSFHGNFAKKGRENTVDPSAPAQCEKTRHLAHRKNISSNQIFNGWYKFVAFTKFLPKKARESRFPHCALCFHGIFAKKWFKLKMLLKSWFHEIFFLRDERNFVIFPHCEEVNFCFPFPWTKLWGVFTKKSIQFSGIISVTDALWFYDFSFTIFSSFSILSATVWFYFDKLESKVGPRHSNSIKNAIHCPVELIWRRIVPRFMLLIFLHLFLLFIFWK